VQISEDAIDLLTKISFEASLRYGIQLITSSNLVAKRRKVKYLSFLNKYMKII